METNEAFYNGDHIAPILDRLTIEQKLELLDWHPIFTGRCPNCEMLIRETTPTRVHWDCGECDWKDDSNNWTLTGLIGHVSKLRWNLLNLSPQLGI